MPAPSYWPLPPLAVQPAPPAAPPTPGAADFLALFQNLLPRGRAWPRDPGANLTGVLSGLAASAAKARATAVELAGDLFPTDTEQMLPEWQATLGLPDPCAGDDPIYQDALAQVVARLKNTGGQSVPYLISLAATLGATVTIEELSNGRCDETACDESWGAPVAARPSLSFAMVSGCEEPLCEWTGGFPATDWDYALLVTVTGEYSFVWAVGDSDCTEPLTDFSEDALATLTEFAVVDSDANTPLAAWGDAVLECELGRVAPAQEQLIFAYAA